MEVSNMYKLFIDSLNNRVGVYQNGELVEFYDDLNNIEGNIYSAKVKNIVDDMEVAFCNIGIHYFVINSNSRNYFIIKSIK